VIYAYGICEAQATEITEGRRGLGGARLRALRADALAAVYSRHRSLRPRPSRDDVLVHERVLEAVMERGPVLPLRFGTRLGSEQDLEAALRERCEELLPALDRVRGRVELGLRVLGAGPEPSSRAKQSGRDYLLDRLEAQRRAEAVARELHAPLAGLAVASRLRERMQPPTVLVGSYLVAQDAVDGFRSHAEALANRHPDLRVVVTGPWPPYSFTGAEQRHGAGEEEPR
jgi:hypothetical protein